MLLGVLRPPLNDVLATFFMISFCWSEGLKLPNLFAKALFTFSLTFSAAFEAIDAAMLAGEFADDAEDGRLVL